MAVFGNLPMRVAVLTLFTLFALSVEVASAQTPVPATSPAEPRPRLAAMLTGCTTGAEPAARVATFTGSMPRVRRTRRMAMRFELQQRLPGASGYRTVAVPGWGWERSERGRTGFIYSKRVEQLAAPGAYRAVIRLRWYARSGKVLRERRRTTRECVQPDPRPDLVHTRLAARPAAEPGELLYDLVIENVGGSAAGGFAVRLAAGDHAFAATEVASLAPGSRTFLTLRGPRCEPGSMITVLLDPDGAVAEGDEANTYLRPCPAA